MGEGDPLLDRVRIWCSMAKYLVSSGSKWSREANPSPCERAAVMDGPADRRIRAVRDKGLEGERRCEHSAHDG